MSLNVPEFAVDTVAVGGVTVVSIAGEVDLLTGPLLRQALASLEPPLVIDLCGCSFLDSTGIKVIFECFSRRPGVRLACLPESAPARVLGLALRGRIPTHATLEEALTAAGAVADASDGSPGLTVPRRGPTVARWPRSPAGTPRRSTGTSSSSSSACA